jgi:hypothetical protein
MKMGVEQLVECLAGETEVFRQNLPQHCSVHQKSHNLTLTLLNKKCPLNLGFILLVIYNIHSET